MTGTPTGAVLGVLDGGLLTTVQDAGRPDWGHVGVPTSGGADPWSLAVANLLLGNEPGAAALEMTITGPSLVAQTAVTIALSGADLGAHVRGGRRLATGRSHRLAAGEVVDFPGGANASPTSGCRAYLAIPGGIDVPVVLGSRSTCLPGGFGGVEGRPLRTADEIRPDPARRAEEPAAERVWPAADAEVGGPTLAAAAVLRVLPGPDPGLEALLATPWRVGAAADRVGIRLDGDGEGAGDGAAIGGEVTTIGVPWGAIQVPPDGRPIVLGPDHQVTGGYRVAAVVIAADRPLIGQLRPGAPVRLVAVDHAAALEALRDRRDALAAGAAALRDAAGWDALIDAAGG